MMYEPTMPSPWNGTVVVPGADAVAAQPADRTAATSRGFGGGAAVVVAATAVVGAMVVGAMVVGAMVVGAMVVGAMVVGAMAAGAMVVVGALVVADVVAGAVSRGGPLLQLPAVATSASTRSCRRYGMWRKSMHPAS